MVKELLVTGAKDVLVIEDQGRELMIPMVKDFVLAVDLPAGIIQVKPPTWEKP